MLLETHAKKMIPFKGLPIQRLPSELANQIAAGEVIERPASVLKELLENSLDAGSTEIEIIIKKGGLELIKVQDDGCGISKEELSLALEQHATSKITTFSDLEAILSFGFRGEALASIASVSKLILTSCTLHQPMGWRLEKIGRESQFTLNPSPKKVGTTVEVQTLFFNTPARRQFLRSERTEGIYLEQVFKRMALSHPDVSFKIQFSEKNVKRLPRCSDFSAYARRVAELCGKSFIEQAHYLEAESNGLQLKGWVIDKDHLKSNTDLQYFYINGRIIRDKVINHALRQAYAESYEQGRYPAYILFLELDPKSIDVNVHPTKHEVRFQHARIVHAFLTFALVECLTKEEMNIFQKLEKYKNEMVSQGSFLVKDSAKDLVTDSIKVSEKDSADEKFTLIMGEFLIIEKGTETTWVDIKQCHESIIMEKLRGRDSGSSKLLLIPVSIKVQYPQKLSFLHEYLITWGFQWTESGKETLLLRAIPTCLEHIRNEECLRDVFSEMLNLAGDENNVISFLAKKGCLKEYTLEQGRQLFKEYKKITTCSYRNKCIKIFSTKEDFRKFLFK